MVNEIGSPKWKQGQEKTKPPHVRPPLIGCVRPEGPVDGYGTNHRGLVDMAVPSPILAAQQCDIKDAY